MGRRALATSAMCLAGLSGHTRAAAALKPLSLGRATICGLGSSSAACRPRASSRESGFIAHEHSLVQARFQLDGPTVPLVNHSETIGKRRQIRSTWRSTSERASWEFGRRVDYDGNLTLDAENNGVPAPRSPLGLAASSGKTAGGGQWCLASAAPSEWHLQGACDGNAAQAVVVLTFNLFWWQLFGQKNGGEVGEVVAMNAPYDFMGFQECDDISRVLSNAGLEEDYAGLQGGHALAIAYRKAGWSLLQAGNAEVAEDRRDQYYGRRSVQWVRLQSTINGRIVTFLNHHGPLPVGTGGRCGELATAYNILQTIVAHAKANDAVLLVGDFNAEGDSALVRELERRLHKVYSGSAMGGIDHVFTTCGGDRVHNRRNLGSGGSDHDALRVEIAL